MITLINIYLKQTTSFQFVHAVVCHCAEGKKARGEVVNFMEHYKWMGKQERKIRRGTKGSGK